MHQRLLKQWSGYDGVLQLQIFVHLVQRQEELLFSVGYLQLFLLLYDNNRNSLFILYILGGGGGGANYPLAPPPKETLYGISTGS